MSDKKIAQWLRLTDSHPTMVKLNKLYALADKLGLHISFSHNGTIVEDDERDAKLPPLRLEDTDSGEEVEEWPPSTEFKVIFENPKYLEEQQRRHEARMQAFREEEEKKKLQHEEAAKRRKETIQRETEMKEREELARLKNKYKE